MIFNDLLLDENVLQSEYKEWCGSDKTLRFGQMICNKYLIPGMSAPEIFYCEQVGDAYWMIVDVLVNQES